MASDYLWDEFNPQGYYNLIGFYKKEIQFNFIHSFLDSSISEILDIGGGSGRMASPIQKEGFQVKILDINNNAVELAKNRGLDAECIDFNQYKSSIKFDLILSIESLVYIEDKKNFFNNCRNHLKSGGILIFTVPNIYSWRSLLSNMRKEKTDYFHLSFKRYKELIYANDFKIIKTTGYMWMPLKVNSNSRLVYLFQYIEKIFGLKYFISQSPWLLIACRKK